MQDSIPGTGSQRKRISSKVMTENSKGAGGHLAYTYPKMGGDADGYAQWQGARGRPEKPT
jgi:hypothetical protein